MKGQQESLPQILNLPMYQIEKLWNSLAPVPMDLLDLMLKTQRCPTLDYLQHVAQLVKLKITISSEYSFHALTLKKLVIHMSAGMNYEKPFILLLLPFFWLFLFFWQCLSATILFHSLINQTKHCIEYHSALKMVL